MISSLCQDVAFAVRLLSRDRTFTITALVTLALCIGANTAMFGIVRSVVLKPLPFAESDRIVFLYNSYPNAGAARAGTSVPDYFDRLTAVPALDDLALYRQETMTYGDENGAERLASLRATPSLFRLVRIRPSYGRLFRDDEGERGRAMKVILGYGFWQRKFGGDASVVGRTIRLNGNPFDVVGVMPPDFSFLNGTTDLYVPSPIGPAERSDAARHSNTWNMVARLRRDSSVPQAQAQIDALNAANDRRFPEFHRVLKDSGFHTVVVLLQEDVVRDVKRMLFLLWGGVLFVLLIGCVNVANLMSVRVSARRREMATRYAIGGSLPRLARQLVTETLLLAAGGGGAGLLGAWWILGSVAALDLDKLPRGYEVRLDVGTTAVAIGLTLAVGAALGLTPVLGLARLNLAAALQSDGRGLTTSRRANAVRRALATGQVAVALVLLVSAALLLASFRAVLKVDLGFDPSHVVTAAVNLPATSYPDGSSLVAFHRRMLASLRARPDVIAAGIVNAVPFSAGFNNNVIAAENHVMAAGESLVAPVQTIASAGYIEAMRIPLVRGRLFDSRDDAQSNPVVIVDERLARRFWGERDPVGQRMYFPEDASDIGRVSPSTRYLTVIGVVREVQAADPASAPGPVGTYYLAYDQVATRAMTYAVRSRAAASSVVGAMRQQAMAIDPQVPLFRTRPMQEWIDRAFVARRVPMLIAAVFGALALALSAVGIYGVLASSAAQRRREMAVRMALGSTTRGIFALVLKEGAWILGVGLAAGGTGALFVGRVLDAHLYGVAATDLWTILPAAALLSATALVAIGIPSWRASCIDPVRALNA